MKEEKKKYQELLKKIENDQTLLETYTARSTDLKAQLPEIEGALEESASILNSVEKTFALTGNNQRELDQARKAVSQNQDALDIARKSIEYLGKEFVKMQTEQAKLTQLQSIARSRVCLAAARELLADVPDSVGEKIELAYAIACRAGIGDGHAFIQENVFQWPNIEQSAALWNDWAVKNGVN